MTTLRLATFTILLAILLSACLREGVCIEYRNSFVSQVSGPATAAVNQPINLDVSFTIENGCGDFNRFFKTTSGNTITIDVEARYEGCVCTMALETETRPLTFSASQAGTYELKFLKIDGNYLVHTIVVQ